MTLESRCFRDTLGTLHPRFSGEPRIVSLVPSLTELVCELGLSAQLVGRTGFCIHPRAVLRPIPKVGGTKDEPVVEKAGLLRTARLLFEGYAFAHEVLAVSDEAGRDAA